MSAVRWSPLDLKRREWVLNHPGLCKSISLQLKVSAEYVRLVLYGKKETRTEKAKAIVRELKRKGAPV